MLATIGREYKHHALSELSTFQSFGVSLQQTSRSISSTYTIATEGLSAAFAASRISKQAKAAEEAKDDKTNADMEAHIEKMNGHVFTLMWQLTARDIRETIRHVCTKVTHDHSVSDEVRLHRVNGLLALGNLFMAHGGTSKEGLKDLKERMHSQAKPVQSEEESDK